jgi:molybdate transport system substrate-binding protein
MGATEIATGDLTPETPFRLPDMKRMLFASLLALGMCCAPAGAAEIAVFAAASLSDALAQIAPLHAKATGDTLQFNFGASGTLARQIKEGAPADVIFSADELRLDQLEQAGLLLPGTRRTLLGNTLVVVVTADRGAAIATLADLTKPEIRRIAIGEPATVPAGTYAQEHLRRLGLWEPLQARLVPLDNVRAVLAAVEAGNADAGFVYRTDALASRKVRIAVEVPRSEGPKITYPAAVLKSAKSPDAARALVAFLTDPEAQAVFAKFGFLAPN